MKTQKEMITELYQTVIGIPENPLDNGLIGEIAEIKKQVTLTNGTVRGNVGRLNVLENKMDTVEAKVGDLRDVARPIKLTRNQTIGGASGVVTFLSLLVVAVGKALGWW